MTVENANKSYRNSLMLANARKDYDIIEDLEYRIKLTEKKVNIIFDTNKITYKNTHGDYTINQIICDESKIKAVIDWTCACKHPVIWELTRSFFYAEPSSINGDLDLKKFRDYVARYEEIIHLNDYDKENIIKLYYYQLMVCDYYNQYLNAKDSDKKEFLAQAKFATKVLQKQEMCILQ